MHFQKEKVYTDGGITLKAKFPVSLKRRLSKRLRLSASQYLLSIAFKLLQAAALPSFLAAKRYKVLQTKTRARTEEAQFDLRTIFAVLNKVLSLLFQSRFSMILEFSQECSIAIWKSISNSSFSKAKFRKEAMESFTKAFGEKQL